MSELKFLVDAAAAGPILEWARTRMLPDPHGAGPFADQYTTTSVYFDTTRFDTFNQTGSFARSKYRVRRYEGKPQVFLERKLSRPGISFKRRTGLPLKDLEDHARHAQPTAPDFWFWRRVHLRQLHPVCQVSYSRVARVQTTGNGAARLTLDEGIRARQVETLEFPAGRGELVMGLDCILELKFEGVFPPLFDAFLDAFRLAPQAASKYRQSVARLGLQPPSAAGR